MFCDCIFEQSTKFPAASCHHSQSYFLHGVTGMWLALRGLSEPISDSWAAAQVDGQLARAQTLDPGP